MMTHVKTALEWIAFIAVLIIFAHFFSGVNSADCPEDNHGTVSSDRT